MVEAEENSNPDVGSAGRQRPGMLVALFAGLAVGLLAATAGVLVLLWYVSSSEPWDEVARDGEPPRPSATRRGSEPDPSEPVVPENAGAETVVGKQEPDVANDDTVAVKPPSLDSGSGIQTNAEPSRGGIETAPAEPSEGTVRVEQESPTTEVVAQRLPLPDEAVQREIAAQIAELYRPAKGCPDSCALPNVRWPR